MNRSLYRGRDSSGRWISERVKGGSLLTVEEAITPKLQKGGKIIKDQRGQWAHPGKPTQIKGEDITMKGVPYKVKAVTDKGQTAIMEPGQDYKFPGAKYVNEFPQMQTGGRFSMGSAAGPNTDPTYFFKWKFGGVKQPKKAPQSRNSLASLGNLNTQVLINKLPQFEHGGSTTMTIGNTKNNKNDIFKRGAGISKLYPFPFKKGGKMPMGQAGLKFNRISSEPVNSDTLVVDRNRPDISHPAFTDARAAFRADPNAQAVTIGNSSRDQGTATSGQNLVISSWTKPKPVLKPGLNPYGQTATYAGGNQEAAVEPWRNAPRLPAIPTLGMPQVAKSGVKGVRKTK